MMLIFMLKGKSVTGRVGKKLQNSFVAKSSLDEAFDSDGKKHLWKKGKKIKEKKEKIRTQGKS